MVAFEARGDDSENGCDGKGYQHESQDEVAFRAGVRLRLTCVAGIGEQSEVAYGGEEEQEHNPEADGRDTCGSWAAHWSRRQRASRWLGRIGHLIRHKIFRCIRGKMVSPEGEIE